MKTDLVEKACTVCNTGSEYSDLVLGRKQLLREVNMEEDVYVLVCLISSSDRRLDIIFMLLEHR